MKPIQICLDGERYAETYLALRRAKRAWHLLDAALVGAKQLEQDNPDLNRAVDALAALDRQLARLGALLVGRA
jgi:hypothetical protein